MGRWKPPFPEPPRDRMRECIWPKCHAIDLMGRGVRLCVTHAAVVYYAYDKLERPQLYDRERLVEQREREVQEREDALNGKKSAERRAANANLIGWVYYVLVGVHVKIGFTTNMARRMRAYPPDSKVLGVERGDLELEKQRHRQFSAHRALAREWFKDVPEIREHIAVNCVRWEDVHSAATGPSGPTRPMIKPRLRDTRRARHVA